MPSERSIGCYLPGTVVQEIRRMISFDLGDNLAEFRDSLT